jgi:hypothetical protein
MYMALITAASLLGAQEEEAGSGSMKLSRGTGEGGRQGKLQSYVVIPKSIVAVDDYKSSDEETMKDTTVTAGLWEKF